MIRKTAILLIIVIMFLGIVQSAYAENNADRVFIYVSLYGNDENEGTIESPLATLKSARDKIRSLKSEGINPAKGFVVYLREGNYQMNEGLVLTEEDSGTAEAPIVYRSYPGEKATLVGGASISGSSFKKALSASANSFLISSASVFSFPDTISDSSSSTADISPPPRFSALPRLYLLMARLRVIFPKKAANPPGLCGGIAFHTCSHVSLTHSSASSLLPKILPAMAAQ